MEPSSVVTHFIECGVNDFEGIGIRFCIMWILNWLSYGILLTLVTLTHRKDMRKYWSLAIPLLMLFWTTIQPALSAAPESLTVWVNANNSTSDLSFASVKSIFHGDTQSWSSGERVVIFVPPKGSQARHGMLSAIYAMSEGRFQQYWLAKTYQLDVSSSPKEVGKTSILETLLQNTLGGITVLPSNEVLSGSKALLIDGISAGQKGYPLVY